MPASHKVPEPPKLRKSTVYKIVMIIILLLIAYWLWKAYTYLPPPQPLQYPTRLQSPNTRVPPVSV
jgi:hypothetical protein